MTRSGVTSTSPSGLAGPRGDLRHELRRPDADRAGDLLLVGHHGADVLPDLVGLPCILIEPVTSRNASSIEADSTIEVTDPKTSTIALDTAE